MLQPREKLIANDNAPLRRPLKRHDFARPSPSPTRKAIKNSVSFNAKKALSWLAPISTVLAGGVALTQNVPLANLSWPSFVLGIILLLTAIVAKENPRLREISSLMMIVSFTAAIASFLSMNGFSLIGVEILLLVSILAISAGWAFQARTSALLSVFAGLLYLTSYFPALGLLTGISDEVSQLGAGIIPWLVLGQITLAQKIRSSIVLFAAVAAGYIWMISLAKNIPLLDMAGLGFVIAAAHYWFGKFRVENRIFGGEVHRICAWVVATGAALYVQSIWLNMDPVQAKSYWPPNPIWWTILGASMFTLFIVSLQRYKSSHISLFGIFIICAAVLIVPAATIKPDLVYSGFEAIPGLNAHPGLGFVIGATIIAAGFYWLVGGLKYERPLDMSMGTIAIGIEALILFQPEKFNADLGVIFVVSLICALCIGGLVAGVSTDRSQTVENYL